MAAPERFADRSNSSCTAGAVHTWPFATFSLQCNDLSLSGVKQTLASDLPNEFMSTRPSVMGPMRSSPPCDRHAAELTLLSVVRR